MDIPTYYDYFNGTDHFVIEWKFENLGYKEERIVQLTRYILSGL